MREYKVESLHFYVELFDSKSIEKKSTTEIQTKIDEYAAKGYKLISTNASADGGTMHIYLYFESESIF
jgi:hypothetical protein